MSDVERKRQELIEQIKAYGPYCDVLQIDLATPQQAVKYLRSLADGIEAGRYDVKSASISVEKGSALQRLEVQMSDNNLV